MSPKQNMWITLDKIHHECKIAMDPKSKYGPLIEISADVLSSEHLDNSTCMKTSSHTCRKVLKSKAGDINIMYIFGD